MNKDIQDILAGEGLGRIKFGMSRDEVREILGEPDEIDTFTHSENNGESDDLMESWHFDKLELSASFDELEDWRLITLAVSSPDYLFEGKSLIGLEREELVPILHELGLRELEYEDWSSNENADHKLISSEEAGVNFWLDEDVLSEIQWGPLFSEEDDCIEWPE